MTFLASFIGPSAGTPAAHSDYWYVDPKSGFTYMLGATSSEAAMRNSAVYDCVKLVSEDIAKLPLIVYRRLPNGGKERAPNHPLYDVLKSRPNSWQTSFEFRQIMQTHRELRGNGYARIFPGPRGAVDRLEHMDPDGMMSVTRKSNGRLLYKYQNPQSHNIEEIWQDDIFHLRGFSLNGLTGLSTIGVQSEAIKIGIAAQEYQVSSLASGVRLSGVFMHPASLSDKAETNLKESIEKKHQGSRKAGGFMILEEGMQWKEMSMTMQDAQFLELRKLNRTEIAAIFRVPPHKIGDLERAIKANIEHQALEYVIDGLMARLVCWEQAIARDLILAPQVYFAEFLVDALLRGDLRSRYNAYKVGIEAGILSPNEARESENRNPRPGGDRYWQPLNMTTSGKNDSERLARIIRMAGLKMANKELVALRKAIARYEGDAFIDWANEFYRGYKESLMENLQLPEELVDQYVRSGLDQLRSADHFQDIINSWESTRATELVKLAIAA